MADDLSALAEWITPLIEKLSTSERKMLMRRLATTLRTQNVHRIKSQENPDGSRFAPVKKNLRKKKGRIKNKALFSKLRTAKYMKTLSSSDLAAVQIAGSAGRIAAVHHYGLVDKVNGKTGTRYRYPARELMGFTPADEQAIADIIFQHLEQ